MNKNLITQIILRLKSESPAFFKKLQVIAYALIVLGILAYLNQKYQIFITDIVGKICAMLVDVGKAAVGILIASWTGTTDPTLMDDKSKENVINHEQNN